MIVEIAIKDLAVVYALTIDKTSADSLLSLSDKLELRFKFAKNL
jgi:hypothetical protein